MVKEVTAKTRVRMGVSDYSVHVMHLCSVQVHVSELLC